MTPLSPSDTSTEVTAKGAVKTAELRDDGVFLLDQTAIPREVRYAKITTVQEMHHAIQIMIVRGAPAIGVAAAYGLVLSVRHHLPTLKDDFSAFVEAVKQDADYLNTSRPTAVNLQWALERLKGIMGNYTDAPSLAQALEAEARAIHAEDLAMCQAIGRHGATIVPKGGRILTHCNAGALATAGYGTALGVVRAAFAQDPTVQVFADETRPRLQGARLTTWEMVQEGIPVTLLTDNMSAWLMKQGKVDLVVVGADRITSNGDAANKIGTYLLALAAKAHNIPFYVAAPTSTIDFNMPSGDLIPIEDRPEDEVTWIHDETICPEGVNVYNPAFDVTPASLITAIITENGVFKPSELKP